MADATTTQEEFEPGRATREESHRDYRDVLANSGVYQGTPKPGRDKGCVIRHLAIHNNYMNEGYVYHKLPEFDRLDYRQYAIDDSFTPSHSFESDRLLEVLGDIDEPILFEHQEHIESPLTPSSMEEILRAARLLQNTLHIYMYDAAITIIEHLREYRRHSPSVRNTLLDATEIAESSSRVILAQYIGSSFLHPQQPQALECQDTFLPIYEKLLDHFSSQVLRLMVWSVDGDEWRYSSVALLARMIAKLKCIGRNPKEWARQSIKKGKSLEVHVGIRAQDDFHRNVKSDSTFTTMASEYSLRRAFVVDDMTPTLPYYRAMFRQRSYMTSIFRAILGGICGSDNCEIKAEAETATYETNNIVIANDNQQLWSTCNNRQRHITISADERLLRFCSYGWRLALNDMAYLSKSDPHQEGRGIVTCDWQGDTICKDSTERSSGRFEVFCAASYVSIHVLHALSSIFTAKYLRGMLMVAAYAYQDSHPVMYPTERFEMKFSIMAGDIGDWSSYPEKDYSLLSDFNLPEREGKQTPPAPSDRASRNSIFRSLARYTNSSSVSLDKNPDLETGAGSATARDSSNDLTKDYDKWRSTMNTWKTDTGLIIVPCKTYALTLIGIWVIAIAAGAVPLLIVRQQKAVLYELSDVLMLLWAFASFVIVGAKSSYVEPWTWKYFVKCQIPCRGVQELSRTSKVPIQVILLYLYRMVCSREARAKFRTCGPYNGIFPIRSQADLSGFAVDCAFRLETLIACGLLVLKVKGFDGACLICVGWGGEFGSGGSKKLICRLPEQNEHTRSDDLELFFKEDYFAWQIGDGVYSNHRARFG
ncbi:hypothetical protein ACLMJK_007820 [Lecanora helva]